MAARILRDCGRNDVAGTHVTRCVSVPPQVVFAGAAYLGVGGVSTLQISCDPLLNSRAYIQNPD